jgi:hypothetical protein
LRLNEIEPEMNSFPVEMDGYNAKRSGKRKESHF